MDNGNTKQDNGKRMTRGVAAFCAFIIGVLDSIASAMPFWCVAAITLGFGALAVFPVPPIMYVLLSFCCRSKPLLRLCGNSNYALMRVLGFILGQVIGFGSLFLLPFVSLSPDSASESIVILSYTICMVIILIGARLFQKFVEKRVA